MARPNILLVVIDSARADRFSCYDYDRPTTPNIDAFAEEGVRFSSAWAESTWTLPMCFTLLTGLTPREHRSEQHRTLPPQMPTLQGALAGAGYHTMLASGNQFVGKMCGLQRGFDYFHMPIHVFRMSKPLLKYLTRRLGWTDAGGRSLTSGILRRLQQVRRPWFAVVWYNDVHHPYVGKQPFTRRFCRRPMSLGRQFSLLARMRRMQELVATASEEDLADVSDLYDGALAYTDSLVGQVLDGLRRHGAWDDTIVIVTADHGEVLGEHGLISHGRPAGMNVPLVRVPLILRAPGLAPEGAQSEAMVQLADLTHSLASLAGIGDSLAPSAAESADLFAAVSGPGRPYALAERADWPKRSIASARRHSPHFDFEPHLCEMAGVVQDGWKLLHRSRGGHELYDLRTDPGEDDNLIARHPERAADLSQMLLDWRQRAQAHSATEGPVAEVDPGVQERLEGLGYF